MIEVQTIRRELTGVAADASIVGLFEDQGGAPAALAGTPAGALVARLAQAKEIGAAPGDVTVLHGDWGLLAVAGLGPRAKLDAGSAFAAGVAASKKLAARPRGPVAAAFPETDDRAVASAWVEGLVVGTRGPGLRKGEASRHPFESLLLVAAPAATLPDADLAKAAARGRIVGEAVNLARDLANTPPAEKPPAALAKRAEAAAAEAGVEAEVWGRDRIAAERFGGVIGVSAGSEHPPAFVHLRYRKGGDAPATALVGKGVTFDSGGLSLKPSASMEDMKADMTGSAVVLAAVCAVAKLGLPVNLDGYMVLTENMTGGAAMKLGDVLTMRNGKTVEVLNTDAEGRLILADALSYAAEQGPARILDLATLTGACLVALGPKIAGLFGTDDAFAAEVLAASRATGERAWRLPMDDDFKDQLKSHVADLKNIGGKYGGSITAAKFLQQFVGDVPWAHLDIAGPSWADADSPTRDVGGTGCFVRTLVALIEASA